MTIEVELPDGTIVEFPDGTSDDVMSGAIKSHLAETAGSPQAKPGERPAEHGLLHRIGDNLIGFDDGFQSPGENIGQFVNTANESATFGLVGDEAAAAADALVGDISYEEALANRRGKESQYREDHPNWATTADVAGAFAPGLGFANTTLKGLTLGGKVFRGATAGAAGGAAYGFMEGENSGTQRLGNALGAGAVGGAVGAGIPVLGSLVRIGYNKIGPGVAAKVRKIGKGLELDRTGTEMVADAVRLDKPYAATRLAEAGADARVAEMGPATQNLLDMAANVSPKSASEVRDVVEDIASRRAGTFVDNLDRITGRPTGAERRIGDLMQSSAAAREAAYNQAYNAPIDYTTAHGQTLTDLLKRIDPSAVNKANKTLRADGRLGSLVTRSTNDAGEEVFERLPDVRALDYISRSLNDMADPLAGAGKNEAGAFRGLASEIRGALDNAVPEYATARQLGGSVIENRDAIEFGKDILAARVPVDVAEDVIRLMNPGELQFAQYGFRDGIDAMMDKAKRALTDSNMDAREVIKPIQEILSTGGERKVRALFGKEADSILQSAKEAYSALSMRASIAQNSKTQVRSAMQGRLDTAVPMGGSEALMSGKGVIGSLAATGRNILGDPALARQNKKDVVMKRIGDALLARADDPKMGAETIKSLPGMIDRVTGIGSGLENMSTGALSVLQALLAQQQAREGKPINSLVKALQ